MKRSTRILLALLIYVVLVIAALAHLLTPDPEHALIAATAATGSAIFMILRLKPNA